MNHVIVAKHEIASEPRFRLRAAGHGIGPPERLSVRYGVVAQAESDRHLDSDWLLLI